MKRFFVTILVVASLVLQLGFFSCTTKPSDIVVLLDSVSVDSVCPLFHNYEKPACHFKLRMEVPYVQDNNNLTQAIQNFLVSIPRQGAFADETDNTIEAMVKNYLHSYIMQYLQEGKEAIDSYGEDMQGAATWMSYEEQAEGKVTYQQSNFISYQLSVYSYMGGAHGNTTTTNRVFDLKNLQPLTLSKLFDEESLGDVSILIREALAEQNQCESVEQLAQSGVFFSATEIEATENFLIDDKGMTWIYDPYEIAPYAYGPVSVSLGWNDLIELIYEDSSVKAFAKSKITDQE